MSNMGRVQSWLTRAGYHCILIPSADEYLSEFAQPFARRLAWVTGFHGSTGMAAVLGQRAALFLDGRYKSQGERECAGPRVDILDANASVRNDWLARHIRPGERIAIDARLHTALEVEGLRRFAVRHDVVVVDLMRNPIDDLWGSERPVEPAATVFDYPTHFAGAPSVDKRSWLSAHLREDECEWHLLTDPEDVAWLLNVRTHECSVADGSGWHIVPVPLSRALVDAAGQVLWFIERARLEPALAARLRQDAGVTVVDPSQFERYLQERLAQRSVSANLRRTPQRFAALIQERGSLKDDAAVARQRWKKHPNEIERAREGHHRDGRAVIRFMAWLGRAVARETVSELDAARKLSELRGEFEGYRGISMPSMSASGRSAALPHYVPSPASNRILNEHPIYWMDSGGQYYGCSTDNTICMAVGEPEPRHIRAHTLVVKGLIALSCVRFPVGLASSQLDSLARQHLWREGMDYGHGTGHGVGNFMNIHEGPQIRKDGDHPLVAPLQAGMIVSNEPGYYCRDDFGIRVETHLLTVASSHPGFLEFETLSRLPIDPRLIDASLLTGAEKQWLADYHLRIAAGYQGCFDGETGEWLQQIVAAYVAMAGGTPPQ